MKQTKEVQWTDLLRQAVEEPGSMLAAYSNFHGYSLGNQLLALIQCKGREIQPGPIATYPKWKELGRQVRKGEKALMLCMPITVKKKADQDEDGEDEHFTRFVYRNRWFVLGQTDGPAVEFPPAPKWDRDRALGTLGVELVPFKETDGNVQGYARAGRKIAINPVAALPLKTLFHEVAHVLLAHTETGQLADTDTLPRSLREAEAEAVALLCLDSLELDGAEYCRGYIQNWLEGAEIPEKSARRIFKVADQILKAGQA